MTLVELIVRVHEVLDIAEVPHAFGGALALAYVAEPRGTVDVDVNVFVGLEELDPVIDALASTGLAPADDRRTWAPVSGIRFVHDVEPFPVDLFPSLDDRYDEIADRCVTHPFGPDENELPFLSAEDLAVFKLSFGRDQDWVDLRQILRFRPDLDLDYVERQLIGLRGSTMYPRLARLRQLRP